MPEKGSPNKRATGPRASTVMPFLSFLSSCPSVFQRTPHKFQEAQAQALLSYSCLLACSPTLRPTRRCHIIPSRTAKPPRSLRSARTNGQSPRSLGRPSNEVMNLRVHHPGTVVAVFLGTHALWTSHHAGAENYKESTRRPDRVEASKRASPRSCLCFFPSAKRRALRSMRNEVDERAASLILVPATQHV